MLHRPGSDRFGDYGIVGVLIFSQNSAGSDPRHIPANCRVLGRGVEHRVMAWLGALAVERGMPFVTAAFEATTKNLPARQFLESVGSDLRFDSASLAALEWRPPSAPGDSQPAAPKQKARTGFRSLDFTRIAANLSSCLSQILKEMSTGNGTGHTPIPA